MTTGLPGDPTESSRPAARGHAWPWALALAAAVALMAGGIVALNAGTGRPDPDHTAMAAVTVRLTDLTPATAAMYEYAGSHQEQLTQIPCYCGCDRTLAHRSLGDCFVTASGEWDAHASGCGVCTAEALQAQTELDAGTPISTVRDHIVARYAGATLTGGSTS